MLLTYRCTRSTQAASLRIRKIGGAQAGVVENDVVLEGFGQIVVAGLREIQNGLLALRVGKRLQQSQTIVLFLLKNLHTFVLAGVRAHRLRAEEVRRHDHLIAENEVIDDGVVAVEAPAPGVGGGRLAHDGEVIEFVAEEDVVIAELGERFVEAHDVAREFKAARAERNAHQAERGVALRRRHFLNADSLAHVKVLVHPFAPLDVVDWVEAARELHARQRSR